MGPEQEAMERQMMQGGAPPQQGPPGQPQVPDEGSGVDWQATSFPQLLEIVHGGLTRMQAVVEGAPNLPDEVRAQAVGLVDGFKGLVSQLTAQEETPPPAQQQALPPGAVPQGQVPVEAGVRGIPKV